MAHDEGGRIQRPGEFHRREAEGSVQAAPIWSVPVYDEKRNHVIITSGENTSTPAPTRPMQSSRSILIPASPPGSIRRWRRTCGTWRAMSARNQRPQLPCPLGATAVTMTLAQAPSLRRRAARTSSSPARNQVIAWALDAKTGKVWRASA